MGLSTSIRSSISIWLGLIRFSHTIFALPFAALATVMAYATPLPSGELPPVTVGSILGVLSCMVFARSAAMAFNRLVDREIDLRNPRTAGRHLPAGLVSVGSVRWFTLLCSVGFVLSTLLFLPNWLPLVFSLPVLFFLCGYSLAKRFTSAAHLWLGIALSLSPICVWVAIRGPGSAVIASEWIAPLVLACGVAAWVTGFDIIYACQDAAYDVSVGLHSVPARFGVAGALRIALVMHLIMLLVLSLLPWLDSGVSLGWIFEAGVISSAVLVIRQHRLVSPTDLARVNEAFFQANASISLILLLFGSVDTLIR
ncbi:putative 4-hydroxybenzoate polyprenyltransferase [bacterium]|nr:putative 4-hydroxybenzoate polyprenyltransferase [bacterium]